jgi:hypothetical protein
MTLMLDPSLLLRPWTLEDVSHARPAAVSATFLERARDGALSDPALAFFGPRGLGRRDLVELARLVASDRGLEAHRAAPETALPLAIRDPVVREILLDEWSFLRPGAWIASRVRRPFTSFVRGGAAAVQLGRDELAEWDELPGPLSLEGRLRVAANWVAVGADAPLVEALTSALPTPAAGAFLLFED